MEEVTGISQILIALAVAGIAWQQYKLTKKQAYIDEQRIKHELFDRRLEFINETKIYIKPWDNEDLSSFSVHMDKARLIFPESPIAQLKIMHDIGRVHLERVHREDLHASETPESKKERLEEDIIEKLNTHYGRFVRGIEGLIKIEDYNA